MNEVFVRTYTDLVWCGRRTLDQVPKIYREAVAKEIEKKKTSNIL